METPKDPLAVLATDDRVAAAVLAAREEVDALLWRRDVRGAAAEVAAASVERGARDSAAIDGADIAIVEDSPMGQVLDAAIRLTAAVPTQLDVFTTAPLQALAHLHALTAIGFVPEDEKANYYRLADLFVMPGWGEGFGIVYLESAACGVPVLGSTLDASQEVIRTAGIGDAVNPKNAEELREAILRMLKNPAKGPFPGLARYNRKAFRQRVEELLRKSGLGGEP